ncbi:putative acetylserotonin methytransferase-like protein [Golovinomyces cichoracearum]|uniref:Putative acetylserotonin methytransferase-like protein n=1 Tax=Golovinomyces cichoracearum TaxID=62708 RepID=A0A420HXX2_9PEZI|nr:putative acetylserotonin methytransferase-like protein [Golovinomyces cichoracearum]
MKSEVSLNSAYRQKETVPDVARPLQERHRSASDARRSAFASRNHSQQQSSSRKPKRSIRSSTKDLSSSESDSSENETQSSDSSINSLSLNSSCPQLPPILPTVELFSEAHIATHILSADNEISESTTIVMTENNSYKDEKLVINSNTINTSQEHNFIPINLAHLPPAFLARRGYLPIIDSSYLQSPIEMSWQDDIILEPSRREELRELWNCASGWQESSYVGRRFCLKITTIHAEVPMYVLSSSTQAFYCIKYRRTSNSTQMNLMRYDPDKNASISILGFSKFDKGIEVISTTLEKNAHKIPLDDGLVAFLYPRAASKKFVQLATRLSRREGADLAVSALENECARLVWDGDSGCYYLVHPAMRTPFLISISTTADTSTIQYMLEHTELPRNLVTLVRDGAGGGFLEIDTACAAVVPSQCIIDTAVCAIMIVALLTEEKMAEIEKLNVSLALERSRNSQLASNGDNDLAEIMKVTSASDELAFSEVQLTDLERQTNKATGSAKKPPTKGILDGIVMWIINLFKFFISLLSSSKRV